MSKKYDGYNPKQAMAGRICDGLQSFWFGMGGSNELIEYLRYIGRMKGKTLDELTDEILVEWFERQAKECESMCRERARPW